MSDEVKFEIPNDLLAESQGRPIQFISPNQIRDLNFGDARGQMTMALSDDCTPAEGVKLSILIAIMLQPGGNYDWREYITRHDLLRHFKEKQL